MSRRDRKEEGKTWLPSGATKPKSQTQVVTRSNRKTTKPKTATKTPPSPKETLDRVARLITSEYTNENNSDAAIRLLSGLNAEDIATNLSSYHKFTILDYAIQHHSNKVFEYLVGRKDITIDYDDLLKKAIIQNNYSAVKYLVNHGVNINHNPQNEYEYESGSQLFYALYRGNVSSEEGKKIVTFLLERGADIYNISDIFTDSAIPKILSLGSITVNTALLNRLIAITQEKLETKRSNGENITADHFPIMEYIFPLDSGEEYVYKPKPLVEAFREFFSYHIYRNPEGDIACILNINTTLLALEMMDAELGNQNESSVKAKALALVTTDRSLPNIENLFFFRAITNPALLLSDEFDQFIQASQDNAQKRFLSIFQKCYEAIPEANRQDPKAIINARNLANFFYKNHQLNIDDFVNSLEQEEIANFKSSKKLLMEETVRRAKKSILKYFIEGKKSKALANVEGDKEKTDRVENFFAAHNTAASQLLILDPLQIAAIQAASDAIERHLAKSDEELGVWNKDRSKEINEIAQIFAEKDQNGNPITPIAPEIAQIIAEQASTASVLIEFTEEQFAANPWLRFVNDFILKILEELDLLKKTPRQIVEEEKERQKIFEDVLPQFPDDNSPPQNSVAGAAATSAQDQDNSQNSTSPSAS